MPRTIAVLAAFLVIAGSAAPRAAELKPEAIAAFDRYVRERDAALDRATTFIESQPPGTDLASDPGTTRMSGSQRKVPDGIIHHWIGTIFVRGATLDRAVALLQDYNAHAQIYAPTVARSRLIARDGDTFKFFLRFKTKKVITVVVNSDHEAQFSRPAPNRVAARVHSTRVQEVENPDTPQEKELPIGDDGGYLWRLNTYWRLEEANGGVYVQCESISLTRSIPAAFSWLIGPFVNSVPRETLQFTMDTTRTALTR